MKLVFDFLNFSIPFFTQFKYFYQEQLFCKNCAFSLIFVNIRFSFKFENDLNNSSLQHHPLGRLDEEMHSAVNISSFNFMIK